MTKNANQQAKADAGKLEIDIVPTQIVKDIAEVRMYGTAKYGDPDNWKRVELRRYINAMLRHTLAFWEDPYSVDEESGIPHYKHAECNWSFISELMKEPKRSEEVDEERVYQFYLEHIYCIDEPPRGCGLCPYLENDLCTLPEPLKRVRDWRRGYGVPDSTAKAERE